MRWTPEILADAERRHAAGESWQQIAESLGDTAPGARERLRSMVKAQRRKLRAAGIEPVTTQPAPEPPSVPQQVQAQRERARLRADIAELKRLTERRAWMEEVRDAIREAGLTLEPPELRPEALQQGPFDPEVAVLLLSDLHVGQHTDARINAGWVQTIEVTENQMRRLGDTVLRIWDIQRRSIPWRELVILMMGDGVEGSNMRPSQHRIVDPLVAQQSAALGRMIGELVQRCLTVFEKVTVESVPGNHSRVSEKPGNAGLDVLGPENSWDWVSVAFAEEILRPAISEGRVTVRNHGAFYAVTEVAGKRIIFEHGSTLRGGGSFGGIPYYAIDRAAAAYRDLEGPYDILALGHYHRPYVLPVGYGSLAIGNGALPPTTPFVASAKHSHVRPSQTLLSIHPKKGVTMIRHLYLDTVREAGHGPVGNIDAASC